MSRAEPERGSEGKEVGLEEDIGVVGGWEVGGGEDEGRGGRGELSSAGRRRVPRHHVQSKSTSSSASR